MKLKQECTVIYLILTKNETQLDFITTKCCHNKNFRTTHKLCLLSILIIIIMFVLIYACFPIFLSVYCNIMFAMIKKRRKMKIKLSFE